MLGCIAISFMAFACVRYLEYLVKTQYKKLSPETIKDALLGVKVGIIKNHATKKKYILPTKISQDAKQIYRISGIKIPDKVQAIM